jgi:hypothetical protein
MIEQAEFFAGRARREGGPKSEEQIRRAFRLGFVREPLPEEMDAAKELAEREGLAIVCRALLNANEFVYLF